MSKQLWINIGLLIFIGLLSALFLIPEKEIQKPQPLTTIDRNDIAQITVLRKELENFTFNKQGEAWLMSSPKQFRANNSRINAILKILSVPSRSQLDLTNVDLEILGLAEPTIIMRLNDHEFKFGNTDAIDQYRYVLFNGKIHLIQDFLYHQLMTNAAFFADSRLLPEKTKINSIQFPENKLVFNSQWQLETLMDISPDQLKRIIFNWQNAVAISVSKYTPPAEESFITLSINDGTSIKLVIVENESHLILGRKDLGIQYHMGSDETEKLLLIEGADIKEKTEPVGLELY